MNFSIIFTCQPSYFVSFTRVHSYWMTQENITFGWRGGEVLSNAEAKQTKKKKKESERKNSEANEGN